MSRCSISVWTYGVSKLVDSHWRHQNCQHTYVELSNKPVWNNSKHVLYLRFFNIATLCFDYCFTRSWYSLDEHQEVIWNGSPTGLKEFPVMLSTRWSGCLVRRLIPNHLAWVPGQVTVAPRSSDAARHYYDFTPFPLNGWCKDVTWGYIQRLLLGSYHAMDCICIATGLLHNPPEGPSPIKKARKSTD